MYSSPGLHTGEFSRSMLAGGKSFYSENIPLNYMNAPPVAAYKNNLPEQRIVGESSDKSEYYAGGSWSQVVSQGDDFPARAISGSGSDRALYFNESVVGRSASAVSVRQIDRTESTTYISSQDYNSTVGINRGANAFRPSTTAQYDPYSLGEARYPDIGPISGSGYDFHEDPGSYIPDISHPASSQLKKFNTFQPSEELDLNDAESR